VSEIPNCAKVLLMKRSFTLIELIVSVLIVMLISGGALVYLNEFNSKQKLEKGKEEVLAAIKMIQSNAKGRQLPVDWGSCLGKTEMFYVKLDIISASEGRILRAQANECDTRLIYQNPIKNIGVTDISIMSPASLYPSTILFGAGTGRLIGDTGGTPISDTGTATVIVKNEVEEKEGYQITINAMGQIKKVEYFKF